VCCCRRCCASIARLVKVHKRLILLSLSCLKMLQDTEALCVVAGERVWQLRVDVHILDHGGNLIDAAALAAIAALQHFRRPGVCHDVITHVVLLYLCFC
jgi:exosome complex RNA-binding protein Rrp42 (RNase PH superfamily)